MTDDAEGEGALTASSGNGPGSPLQQFLWASHSSGAVTTFPHRMRIMPDFVETW